MVGGTLDVLTADNTADRVHGAIMTGLNFLDETPVAPIAIGIQVIDIPVHNLPEYRSKYGYGTDDGWNGLGLWLMDTMSVGRDD